MHMVGLRRRNAKNTRKSLLTYRLAYLFQNAPNLGKKDNLSKEIALGDSAHY